MVCPSQGDKGYIYSSWFEGLENARNRGGPRETRRNMGIYTPYPRKDTFIPLIKTPKEILAMESVSFPEPPPLIGTHEKQNLNKFCDYHEDRDHNTNDCYQLKKKIKEVVTSGKLAHLVKDICRNNQKNGSQGRNNVKKMQSSVGRFFRRNVSSSENNRSSSNHGKGRKKQNGANVVRNNKMSFAIQSHNRKDQKEKPRSDTWKGCKVHAWKEMQWRQGEEKMSRIREQVILRTKSSSGRGPNLGPMLLEKTSGRENTDEVFTISHERPNQYVTMGTMLTTDYKRLLTNVLRENMEIEPTMTLFRAFQTLCKQGDWFSFAESRSPSPVFIDDNRSCMKHWKSGFFLINRRAISDAMVWRHPDTGIEDPRSAAGSFSMVDARQLSAHYFGVPIEMEEPHLNIRPTLQRFPFYYTPPAVVDVVILNPTPKDLAVSTPSVNILAKAEASQKRKASTSDATSSHVAKRTRSTFAQSSGSTNRPSLFVGNSDDGSDGNDDACVEILLVTPLRSAVVIPSLGNQGRSSTAPVAEGPNTRVMADDADAPSVGVSRPRPSFGPVPSFRDVSGGAIHADFFPFSAGPYYATYPQDGIAGNCEFTREEWDASYRPTFGVLAKEVFKDPIVCKTMVDQFPTPEEIVRVEALSDDHLNAKISVLHYMMMSHGGELLARYRGLLQSHHEYVQSTDSRLKGYKEKVAGAAGLELQVSTLKKQISGLNDKLSSSDVSFAKSKAKGKERKKKIKSLTKSLDNLHVEVTRLSAALNQATVLEAEKDEEILHLKTTPPEFASFFRGQFQDLVWKFLASNEFSRVQGELLSLAAYNNLLASAAICKNRGVTDWYQRLGYREQVMSSSPHSTIVPSDSDIEDAFSSTNILNYFPASLENIFPNPFEKISSPKDTETSVESPISISPSSSVGSSLIVRPTTPPPNYFFDESIFAELDNSLWIIPRLLGSEPVPEEPNELDAYESIHLWK
ncbi:hypothetical protein Tco_0612383 [Tanacetum coccineum]